MGLGQSTNKEEPKYDNFYEILNDIATNYILTMDFKSMKSLAEKEYCDDLVVLTGDIIARYFTDAQIQYLEQKIKNGEEINEMTQQNVVYFNRDTLNNVDIQNDRMKSVKKKRVCIGIAKYYVKIAHIFAAIVTTINPVYVFTDPETGERVKKTLFEKTEIPTGVKRDIYKINICDSRIKALKRTTEPKPAAADAADATTDDVLMHPKVCDMTKPGESLADEPGIVELENLYFDDEYDYATGAFKGMSDATRRQYEADLLTFYKTFTGGDQMPDNIKRFSDIKLKDYGTTNGCTGGPDAIMNLTTPINKNSELYVKYADNIRNMIDRANKLQKQLLNVINILFAHVSDPYTGKQKIRINPSLTDDTLQKAVVMARQIIVQLYVQCEKDYVEGVKIYEAIVQTQILTTTKRQLNNLQNKADNIVQSYKPPPPPSPSSPSSNPVQPPQQPVPFAPDTPQQPRNSPQQPFMSPIQAPSRPMNQLFMNQQTPLPQQQQPQQQQQPFMSMQSKPQAPPPPKQQQPFMSMQSRPQAPPPPRQQAATMRQVPPPQFAMSPPRQQYPPMSPPRQQMGRERGQMVRFNDQPQPQPQPQQQRPIRPINRSPVEIMNTPPQQQQQQPVRRKVPNPFTNPADNVAPSFAV